MPRRGRRPGPNTTKETILRIARRRFAAAGFAAVSLRSIAAESEVDPAVVVHFFGAKEGLFRAAVGWPFDPALIDARIAALPDESLGARVARVFLGFWDDAETGAALRALLRSAMTHDESATLLRHFVAQQLVVRIGAFVDGPNTALRANLAASHLIGVAVLRYILAVEPMASLSSDELVEWLTPALCRYLENEEFMETPCI